MQVAEDEGNVAVAGPCVPGVLGDPVRVVLQAEPVVRGVQRGAVIPVCAKHEADNFAAWALASGEDVPRGRIPGRGGGGLLRVAGQLESQLELRRRVWA